MGPSYEVGLAGDAVLWQNSPGHVVTDTAAVESETPFEDLDQASAFARGPIAQIYSLGVTTGTSATTYSPLPSVTRDQMAAFLGRLIDAIY